MTTRTVSVELEAKINRYATEMTRAAQLTDNAERSVKAAQVATDRYATAQTKAAIAVEKYGAKSKQATSAIERAARAEKTAQNATDRARIATEKVTASDRQRAAQADKTNKKVRESASSTQGLNQALGMNVVTGAAAVYALKKVLDAASDLNESQSKVGVVFGDQADQILAWSETSAEAMGLSTQQALEAAGTYGNLFTTMGVAPGVTAEMSTSLVQLASDLASFNNQDPSEVLDALRSGLSGETEPLKRFGITLYDADLRQRALALGLVKTTKEVLPAAAKAQATYSLVMEQTKTAQGDFARTADGAANSQRIMTANAADLRAELGQNLLPVYTQLLAAGNDVLGAFNALPGPVQASVVQFGLLTAAAVLLAPKIMEIRRATIQMSKAQLATKAGAAALLFVGLSAANAAGDVKSLNAEAERLADQDFGKSTSSQMSELEAGVGALQTRVDELNKRGEGGFLERVGKNLLNVGDAIALTQDRLTEGSWQWDRYQDAIDEAQTELQGYNQVIIETAFATGVSEAKVRELADANGIDLTDGYLKAKSSLIGYVNEQVKGSAASAEGAEAARVLGDASATAAESQEAYNTALDKTIGLVLRVRGDQRALEAAYDDATEAVAKNGATLKDTTEKGRDNATKLDAIAAAGIAAAKSIREKTGDDKKANEVLADAREKYIELADKMGKSKTGAEALAEKVGLVKEKVDKVPKSHKTTFKTEAKETPQAAAILDYLRGRSRSEQVAAALGVAVNMEQVVSASQMSVNASSVTITGGIKRAAGGFVSGPGTKTSDSIPAWLSNGEYVIKADAVAHYGVGFLDSVNAQALAAGGPVGYAAGGPVASAVDLSGLLSAWREAIGVITREELNSARERRTSSAEAVPEARRDLRDARRGLRDTKESNKESLAAARAAVRQAERDVKNAKTKKEREKAERALEKAEDARARTKRDNAESLEEAEYRLAQSEKSLREARSESTAATAAAAQAEKDYAKGTGSPLAQAAAALGMDNAAQTTFLRNVETLASRGHTALAAQLLATPGEESAAIAADAVKSTDAAVRAMGAQLTASQNLASKADALPTVFQILDLLAGDKNMGVAQMAHRLGIDMITLQQHAATSKELIRTAGGATFLDEMKRNGFRDGGYVWGAGTSRSDSIPAWLSRGEFVMNAQSTAAIGPGNLAAMNQGRPVRMAAQGNRTVNIKLAPVFQGITDVDQIMSRLEPLVESVAANATADSFDDFTRTVPA